MRDFLNESELTERRAFIKSFVKEIVVMPGKAAIVYSIPTPEDSPIGGSGRRRGRPERRSSQYSTSGGPTRTELSLSQKGICRQVHSDAKV